MCFDLHSGIGFWIAHLVVFYFRYEWKSELVHYCIGTRLLVHLICPIWSLLIQIAVLELNKTYHPWSLRHAGHSPHSRVAQIAFNPLEWRSAVASRQFLYSTEEDLRLVFGVCGDSFKWKFRMPLRLYESASDCGARALDSTRINSLSESSSCRAVIKPAPLRAEHALRKRTLSLIAILVPFI